MEKNVSRPRWYRRKYFIEKKFQTAFMLKFCAFIAVTGLLTMAALYFLVTRSTTVSIVDSRVVVRTTADFLLPMLIQTVLVVVVVVSFAAALMALFASHRIVGPLYRFKKMIRALGEGDFTSDFKIRRPDQMQDLARVFNDSITKLRRQIDALKEKGSSLIDKLGSMSYKECSAASLKELKKLSEELNKIIRYFKS